MSERDRLHTGELYDPLDHDLFEEQLERLELLYEYNATRPKEQERRRQLLGKMLAEVGEGCYIEPPLHANWSGKFVHFGDGVYANFNLTLVDDTHIHVGNNTLFGPNVTLTTAGHPLDPGLRRHGLQYNLPIHIGDNVWIGAGATVLAGVTIGDNTVIGAGSIVTKNIPSGVLALGTPCRVVRPIGEQDRQFYRRDCPIPEEVRRKYGAE